MDYPVGITGMDFFRNLRKRAEEAPEVKLVQA
jgi:hypothetical protein